MPSRGPLFSSAACAALPALFGADGQFWADLLKDGFNCSDLAKHGVGSVIIRGERIGNVAARLPFGVPAAT